MQLPGARGKKETGCKRAGDRDVLYHHCNCAHMTVSTCQNPSNHTLTLFSTNVIICKFSSVQFSHSVMSDSLWPHEPQHARPPCPSPTPRVYANPSPMSRWCHPTISSSVVPFSSCLQSFLNIKVFSNESALHIRCPKYWSFRFNICPSNECPGLISFRMYWIDPLAV